MGYSDFMPREQREYAETRFFILPREKMTRELSDALDREDFFGDLSNEMIALVKKIDVHKRRTSRFVIPSHCLITLVITL